MLAASVLTFRYDGSLDGLDSQETVLTPSNVTSDQFGKLYSMPVDGQVYAQPLNVPSLAIPGEGTHNVLFIATENDSVYADDADNGNTLWHDSLDNPSAGVTPVPSGDLPDPYAIAPMVGITSAPVIDPTTDTLYVVAYTKDVSGSSVSYEYSLYALDAATGAEIDGGPVTIFGSVNGTGEGNDGQGHVVFNALQQDQRPALLLLNGVVYVSFASWGDSQPYHGWVMGYRAATLQQVAVFNGTPNGAEGGIWLNNGGMATDGTYIYLSTGNGTFDTTLNSSGFPIDGDYGDSVIKLAVDPSSSPTNQNINGWGLKVGDYFTPDNEQTLDDDDLDLDSGGIMLLPPQPGPYPKELVAAGKQGTIYVINCDNMGKFNPDANDNVQELDGVLGSDGTLGGSFDTPAYFNGDVYYGGVGDDLEAFQVNDGLLSTSPSSESANAFQYPGASPIVSANGTSDGIVWALETSNALQSPAVLYAYDASNLSDELYNSQQVASRDQAGLAVRFMAPVVANGKVFVATDGEIDVYGLLNPLATAVFLGTDSTTQGNWSGKYGTAGYNVINSGSSYPSSVIVTPSNELSYTWSTTTTSMQALEDAPGTGTGRIAACWYSGTSFTVDLNFTDGQTHDIELYLLDYNGNNARREQIQLSNASTSAVLATETATDFSNGIYDTWTVSGNVLITFTCETGPNAILNGLFIDPPLTTATYLGSDARTQGNWSGKYGTVGYNVINSGSSYPSSVTVTPSNELSYTWSTTTTSVQALEDAPGTGTGRIAACWYSGTSFTVDLNFTDGQTHDIELYLLDYNGNNARREQIQLSNASTSAVLATETATDFSNGIYYNWTVSGNVLITFTRETGPNAILNGLFIDPPLTTATYLGSDVSTEGNWSGKYGTVGYNVINSGSSYPSSVTVTPSNELSYTWSTTTTSVQALEDAPGTGTGRIAACWYSGTSFTVDLNFTDGQTHDIELYLLDYNGNNARREQIQLSNASTSAVLATETATDFSNGIYYNWTVAGNVLITFTCETGPNAILNGLFIDAPLTTATYLGSDVSTEGNWSGKYGTVGYNVINSGSSYPSSVTVTPSNELSYTWSTATTSVQALEDAPGTGTGRIAACWYSGTSFTVDLNFTDGQTHDIELYLLDYNGNNARREQIQLSNASTSAVLATETATDFSNGIYYNWTVSGNVLITFTRETGSNAILNGLFIDPPPANSPGVVLAAIGSRPQPGELDVAGPLSNVRAGLSDALPAPRFANWDEGPAALSPSELSKPAVPVPCPYLPLDVVDQALGALASWPAPQSHFGDLAWEQTRRATRRLD